MTAFIERFPRQGVELSARGDVGSPYRPERVESALWACIGFLGGMFACALFVYSLVSVQA